MTPLQFATFVLDFVLVLATIIVYVARPQIGGQLARGLRILLIGLVIIGLSSLVETVVFSLYVLDLQLVELVFRVLISFGFIWIIWGFILMRQAFKD
ncbi:MAG: hypothetical protein HY868_06995 [Chloroflexi bacterium]|nr:hypothetical protein [Chloroflexota bacterium]